MPQQTAAGFYQLIVNGTPPPSTYDPTVQWDYYFNAGDDTKADWVTELGGDLATTMFISAPHLSGVSFGAEPALKSNTIVHHSANPPEGYFVNSTDGSIELTLNVGEVELKQSMASTSATNGLVPGIGDFLRGFTLVFNGHANDDLVKGSGSLYPTAKIENSGGLRVKVSDNLNTLEDGTGTDTTECPFYFSPSPTTGQRIFFAYMRDVSEKNYYWWYGVVAPGANRTNLSKLDGITTNGVYLKTSTGVRNDNQAVKTIKVNEGTGVVEILFKKTPVDYATANAIVEEHFEYLVSLL